MNDLPLRLNALLPTNGESLETDASSDRFLDELRLIPDPNVETNNFQRRKRGEKVHLGVGNAAGKAQMTQCRLSLSTNILQLLYTVVCW